MIRLDVKETANLFKSSLMYNRITSRKKIRKAKKQKHPSAYERQYYSIIKNIVQRFVSLTQERVLGNLDRWIYLHKMINDGGVKLDDWDDEFEDYMEAEEELSTEIFTDKKSTLVNALTGILLGTELFNSKQFTETIEEMVDIKPYTPELWMKGLQKSWIQDNVSLIKGLTDEYRKKTASVINSGINKGITYDALAEKIRNIGDMYTGYRAEFVARDQLSKFNGDLTRKRQSDIGADWYIWRTMKDERVREEPDDNHRVMEGMLCQWEDPTVYSDDDGKTWKKKSGIGAPDLHPTEDYNCRCYAEVYLNNIVDDIDDELSKE